MLLFPKSVFFFFNDTATTEIYPLSLHDALPILLEVAVLEHRGGDAGGDPHELVELLDPGRRGHALGRSEEHTSELQSLTNLVCRLLLEKKKNHSKES